MNYKLEKINAKDYEGNVIFLYGDDVADRLLPLSRKELEIVKAKRENKKDFQVVFDRLPYRLYLQ